MYKRLLGLAIVISLIGALFTGCSTREEISYTVVKDLNQLPAAIRSAFDLAGHVGGYIWLKDGESTYVSISTGDGAQTTVGIDSVKLAGGAAQVKVVIGSQAGIKRVIVRIPTVNVRAVTVNDDGGTVWQQLLVAAGTYNGQIDSHSVEISTQDGTSTFEIGAAAAFFDPASPDFRDLEAKDNVRFVYFNRAEQPRILAYIDKAK